MIGGGMKQRVAGLACEVAGLGGIAYAGYVATPALGYALAGIALILIGIVLGARP
jgi:hypothetical protein